MSRADRLGRASKLSGLALRASRVQESLYRWQAGAKLDEDDKWGYALIAELFTKALQAHDYTLALIMGEVPPECRDFVECADAMKFVTRLLPADVKRPEAEMARYRDLFTAFVKDKAEPAMFEPVMALAGKVINAAGGESQHILDGLYD